MNYTRDVINRSNAWYNDGLRKAQVRDLSGAIVSLRRSLQYYRGNVDARNLLGLVYYGQGEVAEGLVEWIISKNIKPKNNLANHFIDRIQVTPDKLEVVNQAIKMYNKSLIICEQDGDDMAIIQLKKAVADFPSLLKAWQLLALLYMHTEQYTKARQALVTARKIDTANETTLRYIQAMSRIRATGSRGRKRSKTVEYKRGNETIIQPRNFAVPKAISSRVMVANILFGVIIGAAVIWYLVAPAAQQSRNLAINDQMIEYSQRIQSLEAQVSAQGRALEEYRIVSAATDAEGFAAAGIQESFEILLRVNDQFNAGGFSAEQLATDLMMVNRDLLGERGQAIYDRLAPNIFPVVIQRSFEAGMESFNVGNYLGAIDQLTRVIRIEEGFNEGSAMLSLGIAYENTGDIEMAVGMYRRLIELFPYQEIAQRAQERIDGIEGEPIVEPDLDEE